MNRVFFLFLLLCFPVMAQSPTPQTTVAIAPGSWPAGQNAGLPYNAVTASPLPFTGFGNLVGTGASARLSTLTPGPNSAAWPAAPGYVAVIATGGTGYVCPAGGTCSAAVGMPIGGIVAGWGFFKPTASMTVFGSASITFTAQW